MKTGLILLAAGSSSRLGSPKQLIEFQGKKLLQKAVEEGLKSKVDSMVVVLGWNPELIKSSFDPKKTPFVVNTNWEEGMASSMQTGLRFLMEKEDPDQVILMLCDQPFVDVSLLDRMILDKEEPRKGIVACAYSDTLGVPALFDKHYFEELMALKGSEGAKKVILSHVEEVIAIDFPEGEIDLDTKEDLIRIQKLFPSTEE
ncbi:molybdenum cofactor cytidylyltransferase [Algoriphagus faecimaris]|uniref:Molybdenum cofactor cytidylyltransferase n=1 Tax=Algoriphagus faecimaris TaxID=686796 RepID=A0A1G6PMX6_9BACT|nr:nucleotidyltransferase family protein [Algoriphagus faecimaris]SDC80727.1 molybdenum cofactor cytidylyltransferase [Algoriphagus faecimaris]